MRTICEFALMVILAGIGILCFENQYRVEVGCFGNSWRLPLPVLLICVYFLGTTTGGSLWSLLRSSFRPAIPNNAS